MHVTLPTPEETPEETPLLDDEVSARKKK